MSMPHLLQDLFAGFFLHANSGVQHRSWGYFGILGSAQPIGSHSGNFPLASLSPLGSVRCFGRRYCIVPMAQVIPPVSTSLWPNVDASWTRGRGACSMQGCSQRPAAYPPIHPPLLPTLTAQTGLLMTPACHVTKMDNSFHKIPCQFQMYQVRHP